MIENTTTTTTTITTTRIDPTNVAAPNSSSIISSSTNDELYIVLVPLMNKIVTSRNNQYFNVCSDENDITIVSVNDKSDSLPYIVLHSGQVIGKNELLQAMQNNNFGDGKKLSLMNSIRNWVKPCIPSRLIRIELVSEMVNDTTVTDTTTTTTKNNVSIFLYIRNVSYATKNYVHLINDINNPTTSTILNGHTKNSDSTVATIIDSSTSNISEWMGPYPIQLGDIIQFLPATTGSTSPSFDPKMHKQPTPLQFQFCRCTKPKQERQTSSHTNEFIDNKDVCKANDSNIINSKMAVATNSVAIDESTSREPEQNVQRSPSDTSSSPSISNKLSAADTVEESNNNNNKNFIFYFVEKGTDMHHTHHIPALHKNAVRRGATVLYNNPFNNALCQNQETSSSSPQPLYPTYLIISSTISSLDSVAIKLGFQTLDEMSDFIQEKSIVCATRDWAAEQSTAPYSKPSITQQIPGFRSSKAKRQRIEKLLLPKQSQADVQKLNRPISDMFRTLAKLHQDCPLYVNDDWKSYMFQLVSGRILQLDFEISNDTIQRLSTIKGFGSSTVQIIKDFLDTDKTSCQRIHEFENDPQRVAMKVMMNIWGVGRVRATELVQAGYKRIGDVRHAVQNGMLHLDRNQYIGLLCYEDIMERMPRIEVEAIADVVATSVQSRYPGCETIIMGSYRRGKVTCGDVDILITHPDHFDTVPSSALGEIVDDLCKSDHIAYHLTFIAGMKPEAFETLPRHVASQLTNPSSSYGRSREKKDKYSMSSWMGVFNSPIISGKYRRVDIKFYPYSERFFASLYFTGNGHFNRSMRLWATRKFNYLLSDHGLVDKNTESPIITNPSCEKDVFDVLGLKWKEVTERDCFDDVEPFDTVSVADMKELTREELARENSEHVWIE